MRWTPSALVGFALVGACSNTGSGGGEVAQGDQPPLLLSVQRVTDPLGSGCAVYTKARNTSDTLIDSVIVKAQAYSSEGQPIGNGIAHFANVRSGGADIQYFNFSNVPCQDIVSMEVTSRDPIEVEEGGPVSLKIAS